MYRVYVTYSAHIQFVFFAFVVIITVDFLWESKDGTQKTIIIFFFAP